MYGVKSVYTPFFCYVSRVDWARCIYIIYMYIFGVDVWSRHKFIIVEAKKDIMATYLREMWN